MTEKIKDTFLEDKSEALRTLCLILHNKYNVSISSTAEGIGLRVTYYSDFLTSRRKNLKRKNLHVALCMECVDLNSCDNIRLY